MFEHFPERRRYIRSRADLEFHLARISLALARAPDARRADALAWFEEAGEGLLERAAFEHRDYVAGRLEDIRAGFFDGLPHLGYVPRPARGPSAERPRAG